MAVDVGILQKAGETTEAYARSLGAEIYGVASANKYKDIFPDKPQPDKFVEEARSVIITGLPFSRKIMDTVAQPWLAEVHRKGADDVALDPQHAQRPPTGAERYYLGPENAMLIHEVSMIGYRLARKLHEDGHSAFYFPNVQIEPRFKTAHVRRRTGAIGDELFHHQSPVWSAVSGHRHHHRSGTASR